MPGVPSYRGCEACRRQKKKARPACSRCARLKMPCIGCGQRRFKFKDETEALRQAHTPPSDLAVARAAGHAPPSRPLSNRATRTSGAMVSVLQISDPRYDIFVFGPFINDIPSRLGTHAALDASADAFASAFSCVHTRRITPESLAKYAHALRSVQDSLQAPATAYSEQTLCAIYFIMLCQSWIASDHHPFPGHGPAMAHLLNIIVTNNWHNSFNSATLITISVAVLLESIVNPSIQLRPWFFKLAELHRPTAPVHSLDGVALTSVGLHNLILMRDILRNPGQHVVQMQSLYSLLRLELPALRKHLGDKLEPACAGAPDALPARLLRILSRYLAVYSVLLCMGMTLNGFLRALGSCESSLVADMELYFAQTMTHAEDMKPCRPFGASHVPLALICALAATEDDPWRQMATRIALSEYEDDYTSFSWLHKADTLVAAYRRQCHNLSSLATRGWTRYLESRPDGNSQTVINTAVECEPNDACNFL